MVSRCCVHHPGHWQRLCACTLPRHAPLPHACHALQSRNNADPVAIGFPLTRSYAAPASKWASLQADPKEERQSQEVDDEESDLPLGDRDNMDEKKPAEDHHSLDQDFDKGVAQLWPYLSELELSLAAATEGVAMQRLLGLGEDPLSPLDAAVLAAAVVRFPVGSKEQALAAQRLLGARVDKSLSRCSQSVLTAMMRALCDVPAGLNCTGLYKGVAEELVQRRPLSARAAALLVEGLKGDQGVPSSAILAAAEETFANVGAVKALSYAEAISALEGLVQLRESAPPADVWTSAGRVAATLAPSLRGAGGLAMMITRSREDDLGVRALACLCSFSEIAGCGNTTTMLSSLFRGVRWPRERWSGVSEDQVAKAACLLARCGAWSPARCRWLLAFALRRDRLGKTLTPIAGAYWLCAVAEAGETLETATEKGEYCTRQLLDCAEALASPSSNAVTDAAIGRALWGLHALGQHSERGLGDALLSALSKANEASITVETWALLREVRGSINPASASDVDSADVGDDPDAPSSPFDAKSWQNGIQEAAAVEARLFEQTGCGEQLRAALRLVSLVSEDGVQQDLLSEMEELGNLGPYVVAALFRERGVALDFDIHQSPAGRALRRQQWATICPDIRVAEITLAAWELDVHSRADLLRRRIEGIEDEAENESDDDD